MKTFGRLAASCAVLTRPAVYRASPTSSVRVLSRSTPGSSSHHRPLRSSTILPSRTLRYSSTLVTSADHSQTASETSTRESFDPNLEREQAVPEPTTEEPPNPSSERLQETPAYELTFTCKPCKARSTHRISKQGYHKGTVLITCPDCKNRHVISDHLKIFSDTSMTIEDLMRDNGEMLRKGSLSPDGDLEFWDDGSTTQRTEGQESSLPKELNSG